MQDFGRRAFYSVHMCWLRARIPLLLVAVCLLSTAPASYAAPASDQKEAHKAFNRGLKLQESQNLEAALPEFEEAFRLAPSNTEYLAAREMTRQNLAGTHLARGNDDLASGRQAEALAEFRTALALDPQNEFAQQRIRDALGPNPVPRLGPAQVVESADQITAKPIDAPHDFHYRGDSRGLFTAVASSYGLTVLFDDNFPSRTVRFDLNEANFATAIQAASSITKTFVVALEDTVLFVAPETQENHRIYDRMGMRSYYFPGADPAKELNDLMNSLRTLFEFRFVALSAAANTITIRGPIFMLEAATKFLAQLDVQRPELLLDVQVFEVDYTYTRNIGLHVPDQFNLYNIPAAALAALGGQNVQDLINQLIASGGINQAGNTSIAALIAQLQGQQNSIFSQPLATFGGGLTFFGLSLDQLSAVLSLNESSVRSLQHVTLRASQDKEATFKLGSRYPVMNASFSPISNSAPIAGVLQNQSYTAPFPSINYEDLGLTLKAKPLIHNNLDVDLMLSLQFRALGGTSVNGVPIITNREFTGGILLKNGEPAVIAGMVNTVDQRSLNGLPLFSRIPGFGALTSQRSTQKTDDELLIVVTPHVVSEPQQSEAQEIWLSK